jgi:hypothetical protein
MKLIRTKIPTKLKAYSIETEERVQFGTQNAIIIISSLRNGLTVIAIQSLKEDIVTLETVRNDEEKFKSMVISVKKNGAVTSPVTQATGIQKENVVKTDATTKFQKYGNKPKRRKTI